MARGARGLLLRLRERRARRPDLELLGSLVRETGELHLLVGITQIEQISIIPRQALEDARPAPGGGAARGLRRCTLVPRADMRRDIGLRGLGAGVVQHSTPLPGLGLIRPQEEFTFAALAGVKPLALVGRLLLDLEIESREPRVTVT